MGPRNMKLWRSQRAGDRHEALWDKGASKGELFLGGIILFPVLGIFLDCCFPASLLLCFSTVLLLRCFLLFFASQT